jgi:hypothetical protein
MQQAGAFSGLLTGRISDAATVAVVVANCNPSGASTVHIDDLKVYLVR